MTSNGIISTAQRYIKKWNAVMLRFLRMRDNETRYRIANEKKARQSAMVIEMFFTSSFA
jgi:hypothetical protein